jgi:hypothetical protein
MYNMLREVGSDADTGFCCLLDDWVALWTSYNLKPASSYDGRSWWVSLPDVHRLLMLLSGQDTFFPFRGVFIGLAPPNCYCRTLGVKVFGAGMPDSQAWLSVDQQPHSGNVLTVYLTVFYACIP